MDEESKANDKMIIESLGCADPDKEILQSLKSMPISQLKMDLNSVFTDKASAPTLTPRKDSPVSIPETISTLKRTSPLKYYQISNAVKESCVRALADLNSKRISSTYELVYSAANQLLETLK